MELQNLRIAIPPMHLAVYIQLFGLRPYHRVLLGIEVSSFMTRAGVSSDRHKTAAQSPGSRQPQGLISRSSWTTAITPRSRFQLRRRTTNPRSTGSTFTWQKCDDPFHLTDVTSPSTLEETSPNSGVCFLT